MRLSAWFDLTIGLAGAGWAAFMLLFPARWMAVVEKENEFWVRKGLVSSSRADWFKRVESGVWFKTVIAVAGLVSCAIAWLLFVL
jgi:hypothetical protein